jgi:predicted nucleotidyltransferase
MNEKILKEELIVRKVVTSFIEKIFSFNNIEVDHDVLKEILYNKKPYKTKTEEKIKRYYDGYMYLLKNRKNPITNSLLDTFYYILKCREMDSNVKTKIKNKAYFLNNYTPIEYAINLHNIVQEQFKESDKLDYMIIPLMFFNYGLLKNDIPTIRLTINNVIIYDKIKDDKLKLFEFLKEIINNYDFIKEDYINELKELSYNEVYETFIKDKEKLEKEFKVKTLILHGSYAKKNMRIDSDIDILIKFNLDLSYQERKEKIEELKRYYTNKFKRFVDIQELNIYLTDEFIKETQTIKIIINEEGENKYVK